MKKNKETLIDASKEVGLEINVKKTKYMLVSYLKNAGQNQEIKIGNRSFENMSQFKYLGMTVRSQNLILEETKRILNSGSACYHSVQNSVFSFAVDKSKKLEQSAEENIWTKEESSDGRVEKIA
jgi:hypothetical protein